MSDDRGILERIGGEIGTALGEGPSQSRLEAQRRDLLSVMGTLNRPSLLRRSAPLAAAAAAVLLVAAALFGLGERHEPLSFWIGDGLVAGSEGKPLKVSRGETLAVRFEGGTRFALSADARARVVEANTRRVELDLEDGNLKADVEKRKGTKWVVRAGPYQVSVLGTSFSVDWHAGGSVLGIAVERGVVLVSGADLNEPGVRLTAGDRLQVDRNQVLVTNDSAEPPGAAEPRPEQASALSTAQGRQDPAPLADEPVEATAPPKRSKPSKANRAWRTDAVSRTPTSPLTKSTPAPWRTHFDDKEYGKAVAAAERNGLEEMYATLDREDLWRLASAARYSRRGRISTDALLVLRKRFPGSGRAETAAFLLGRVAFELDGDAAAAREWFRTYLNENPGGPLAEEAMGRWIDASRKLGRNEEAKSNARVYLRKYPGGAYSELAHSVLKK